MFQKFFNKRNQEYFSVWESFYNEYFKSNFNSPEKFSRGNKKSIKASTLQQQENISQKENLKPEIPRKQNKELFYKEKNLKLLEFFDDFRGVFKFYFQKSLESNDIQMILVNHMFTTIGNHWFSEINILMSKGRRNRIGANVGFNTSTKKFFDKFWYKRTIGSDYSNPWYLISSVTNPHLIDKVLISTIQLNFFLDIFYWIWKKRIMVQL